VPSIFRNIDSPSAVILTAALCAAAVQCVFLREYLAVFSGNELVAGVVLSLWLLATGLGSLAGKRAKSRVFPGAATALIAAAVAGLFCIRASRLLFSPGELIGPLPVIGLCALSETPFAFINGYLFGILSGSNRTRNPYGVESLGALAGSMIVYAGVLLYFNNDLIILLAILPLLMIARKNLFLTFPLLAVIALFSFNDLSQHWKYPFPFSKVIYGREGEIVRMPGAGDTTFMLNGCVYKSTAEKPFIEQAVHIPMAQRSRHGNALIIFDKGHRAELEKYLGLSIDCIESEPRIASVKSILAAPETYSFGKRYDIILLGGSMPQTAASGRFYTISFFQRMRSLMTDSGVFSFTLPMSENYMSRTEKQLYGVLFNTLKRVFADVLVFPGNGYTFMASDKPLRESWKPHVYTKYLETVIIPSVSPERIATVNGAPKETLINTAKRPIALLLGLRLWTEQFKATSLTVAGIIFLLLILSIALLPKSKEILSMGTTGFATGVYSIALLVLYQSTYGLLYSRISLLLVSLTCGFVSGTRLRRFPLPDLFIGIYCIASLGLLAALPYPPAILFYCAHCAMGLFTGAQFVSMKNTSAGTLYAADLFGGALGMALCSTLFVPLFGIPAVAVGICLIKVLAWAFINPPCPLIKGDAQDRGIAP
jgi:hypothetical protein